MRDGVKKGDGMGNRKRERKSGRGWGGREGRLREATELPYRYEC